MRSPPGAPSSASAEAAPFPSRQPCAGPRPAPFRCEMAAPGGCRLLLRLGRRWLSQEPAVPPPPPGPLYPPVVASHTARSKAARRRRLEHFQRQVHEAASVEEKLRLYGKLQRPKYTVHPQTFALNADRWYRSFTRTAFVPGLPAEAAEEAGVELGALRSLACDALLQESFYQKKRRPFLYRDQEHTPGPFLTQLVSSLAASLCGRNPLLAASSLGAERGRGGVRELRRELRKLWGAGARSLLSDN